MNVKKIKKDIEYSISNSRYIFKIVDVEIGRVVVEIEASERLHNPMGTLYEGILCDIADAAKGNAYISTLAEVHLHMPFLPTIILVINGVRPQIYQWMGIASDRS